MWLTCSCFLSEVRAHSYADSEFESPTAPELVVLEIILPIAAVLVFALNLPSIADEIQQLRVAKPQRVEQDDLELNPPPAPQPSSPWG